MPDAPLGLSRLNSVLLKRPVLAWVIDALVLLSIGRTLRLLDLGHDAEWWWSAVALGFVGYSAVAAMLWPRIVKRRRDEVIAVCWATGLSAALLAFAVVISELAGEWVYWTAAAVTLVLLAATTRVAVSE